MYKNILYCYLSPVEKKRLIQADYKNNYKEDIVPIGIIIPGIKTAFEKENPHLFYPRRKKPWFTI